ncbi:nucleotidyl transferase AbiEii/AbiGii toxin family protein [Yersinia enterocolitica]|uniref:nucleotidyl transferase AbiEii/AbiGii toxin family protein n=1 Tax=Yersinia enterocolitica TaxID=630 RepID=UPI00330210D3|nr:nucleotidyl transferase AbiEii/AbiGii toxin family protein [Yersinia enterocolitica]
MANPTESYTKQVKLLIDCLPIVASETCFALKGGTAINLFIRDFPRLSVDIDLVYVPVSDRDTDLANISAALNRITDALNKRSGVQATKQEHRSDELRILVRTDDTMIKIEVSPVSRGLISPPQEMAVVDSIESTFGFASTSVVSLPDLYGGKICAALDRQHPRDLFDVRLLLDSEGMTKEVYYGFLTYLLGHPRPLSELLSPNWQWENIESLYHSEFEGMTTIPVTLDELKRVPHQLLDAIKMHFSQRDVDFLMSYKSGNPDWSLFYYNVKKLPAIRWKQMNLDKLHKQNPAKWNVAQEKLAATLSRLLNIAD